jgi:hypothetical protein
VTIITECSVRSRIIQTVLEKNMMRKFLFMAGALLLAQAAYAAEAGKVIFVAGSAKVAERQAALNTPVGEGELLVTGADGYIYIKTIDNGLFILRPNSQARIASYHVDNANPANTRIKLELLSGVARSQSGQAVKQARQNFRFNTPVAAIGVRGTDFTVFTDQNTSRVTVLSGGITMSGFAAGCSPDGIGPCEGSATRDLYAAQKGQLLQMQRGQSAPQLLQGNNSLAPDVVAPPRLDEPVKPGGSAVLEPSLDVKKDGALKNQVLALNTPPTPDKPIVTVPPEELVTPPVVTPPVVTPPVVIPPVVTPPTEVPVVTPPVVTPPTETPVEVTPPVVTPPVVETPPVPVRAVSWGRWTAAAGKPATSGVVLEGSDRIALNNNYVLFRSKTGSNYVVPEKGSVSFAMTDGEATVKNLALQTYSRAAVENGQLSFNFDKATFSTQIDVVSAADRFTLANSGRIQKDGIFSVSNKYTPNANMNLTGVLENDKSASYLFDALLDAKRTVSGVTLWGKK